VTHSKLSCASTVRHFEIGNSDSDFGIGNSDIECSAIFDSLRPANLHVRLCHTLELTEQELAEYTVTAAVTASYMIVSTLQPAPEGDMCWILR
jgi:hypothetical protein